VASGVEVAANASDHLSGADNLCRVASINLKSDLSGNASFQNLPAADDANASTRSLGQAKLLAQ